MFPQEPYSTELRFEGTQKAFWLSKVEEGIPGRGRICAKKSRHVQGLSSSSVFIFKFIYCYFLYVGHVCLSLSIGVWDCLCHATCVEVKGQLCGVPFLLSLLMALGIESGHQQGPSCLSHTPWPVVQFYLSLNCKPRTLGRRRFI